MAEIHFDITGDNAQVLKSLKETFEAITKVKNGAEETDKKMQFDSAKKGVQDLESSTKKSSNNIVSSLSSMIAKYLSLTAAVAALAKITKGALETNAEFERKNSELASVLGTSKDAVDGLSQAAQQLGRTTEFTATQVTELQIALARLGFTQPQILDMQSSVLKFASAVNAGLGDAANFAGSVLRAFEFDAKDTTHVLDVLAASTSKSALDFSKLNASMATIAPVAHAFGLELEDTVTLLGALANAGFDASTAATATRNILLNLADSNGKLAKGLGHTAKTFPEIIASLKECADKGIDLNETLEMTDLRSVSAFSALISGSASVDELREALGNCDGALDQMYKTMTDNLIGAVRSLQSAWEGLVLTMQESTGPLANVVSQLARGVNVITDMIEGLSLKDARVKMSGENIFASGEYKTNEDYEKAIADVESSTDRQVKRNKEFLVAALKYAQFKHSMNQQMAAIENMFAEDADNGGGTSGGNGGNTPKLTDKQKNALEKYKSELKKLWLSVDDVAVQAMKEGYEKRLAEIDNEEVKALEAIEDEREVLEKSAKAAGITIADEVYDALDKKRDNVAAIAAKKREEILKEQNDNRLDYLKEYGSYKEKELAITEKYDSEILKTDDEYLKKTLEKQKVSDLYDLYKQENEKRWSYIEQYGDYKEKELAITEKYNAAIENSNDEFEKKILGKEKEQALYELQKQYSDAFSYIFADAQSLTDTQLAKAIEYTQQAIKDATDDGNIEALTQLYAQLREQMSIQADRSRGWGFSGIADAIKLRQKAIDSDLLADAFSAINQDGIWTEEINRLRADARQARKDAEAGLKASIGEIATAFGQLGDAMSSFGDGLGKFGDKIAEIGELFSGIASQASNLQTVFDKNATSADRWSAGISGVMSLVQMVGSQIAKNKQAQDAWNKSIESSEQRMRMLKLEALDYKQQNIFGVENPYKKAIDGALQYSSAMADLQKMQAKLAGGQVQTGTRKAIDWGNVGKGVAAGAVAGAALGGGIFSWLTAGLGAAIGGAVGLISGALSTKVVPVLENLTSVYGQLWDDQYNLSDELIANYDKLDDATKQIVDDWDEIKNKALEAEKQMEENFSNLAGNLGKDLSSSLSEAFRNGELNSAIDSFHDKVTTTIEDIVEQMVFSTIFSDMFDQLQADMKASFGAGGDRNLVDDIMRFDSVWQDGLEEYSEEMQKARDYLQQAGYDVFTNKEEESSRKAATRSSLGASQDSIDESNGRLTAIQGHTFEINENVRRLAAAAGLTTAPVPSATGMGATGTDYSLAIAEVKLAIVAQSTQLAEMGLKVADIQGDVLNMLQSTKRIEDNSTVSKENSLRMRTDLEIVVDKGVTAL